jgi:hypothetical protein
MARWGLALCLAGLALVSAAGPARALPAPIAQMTDSHGARRLRLQEGRQRLGRRLRGSGQQPDRHHGLVRERRLSGAGPLLPGRQRVGPGTQGRPHGRRHRGALTRIGTGARARRRGPGTGCQGADHWGRRFPRSATALATRSMRDTATLCGRLCSVRRLSTPSTARCARTKAAGRGALGTHSRLPFCSGSRSRCRLSTDATTTRLVCACASCCLHDRA